MMERAEHVTLGIDISQKSFDASLCPQGWPPAKWHKLPAIKINHPADSLEGLKALGDWVVLQKAQGQDLLAVVESTGQLSTRFARVAQGRGALGAVSIINPRHSHDFGKSLGVRDKSDAVDARILALFGSIRRPEPTILLEEDHEQVRRLNRLREKYLRDQVSLKNRLREAVIDEERRSIERMIESFEKELEQLEKKLAEAMTHSESLSRQVRLLTQIRGIKKVVAHTLTAELGDLRRYDRGQVASVAGVYPKLYESGSSVRRKPRMAKGGGGRIRRVLYMAASSLFRAKGPWPAVIERFTQRGLNKMQIIGILMRKLLLIARAVAISGRYDESKISYNL